MVFQNVAFFDESRLDFDNRVQQTIASVDGPYLQGIGHAGAIRSGTTALFLLLCYESS